MKPRIFKYIVLFSWFLLAAPLLPTGLAQQYILSNWTVEDGLSSDNVKDILQDDEGMMWIATEHGLNKFDGYTFSKHRYHPADSTTIGANFIEQILEDGEGNIWVLLSVGLISRYNKQSRNFTNFTFPDGEGFIFEIYDIPDLGLAVASSKGLYVIADDRMQKVELDTEEEKPSSVYSLFHQKENEYYICTNVGFKRLDWSTKKMQPVFFTHENDTTSFRGYVKKMYIDSQGTSWIQTNSGSLLQAEDGLHFSFSIRRDRSNPAPKDGTIFLFEDQEQECWTFSDKEGLVKYQRSENSWEPAEENPSNAAFSFVDHNHDFWIFTRSDKLYKRKDGEWELIQDFKDRLKYWEVIDLYIDEENGIWLSSRGKGVWRLYNREWPISSFKNSSNDQLIDFEITALLEGNEEYIWLGTHNNIYKYYFASERLQALFPNAQKKNPLRSGLIPDITQDAEGKLWIATSNGIVISNSDGSDFRALKEVEVKGKKVNINHVRCLMQDEAGRIWIGTVEGLFIYDPAADKFHYYDSKAGPGRALAGANIQCLTQLNATDFLIGYIKYGVELVRLNPADMSLSGEILKFELTRPKNFNLMTANTFYQADGEIWLGTFSRGLLKIDIEKKKIVQLSKDFPIIPNVKGIQKGSNGKLWVSSIDGIRSVDPIDHTFYRFTKSSGLLSNEFHISSDLQDAQGNLYFGSYGGLNKIQPAAWHYQDTVSTPILTNFKNYDQNITFEQVLNEVTSISLTHQDDFIKFEFVSPTYHNPEDVQYAYQLEGFDPDWIYCESQRSAAYTNLDPGNYTFHIKAGNKGGFLNSETKSIELIIAPPFWQRAWFILLVIALALVAIWLIYKIQSNIRQQRLQLANELRKKAADDFHDELGHRLTKIALFVESLMLHKEQIPKQTRHILQKIQDNANELFYSTKDFIWAMNPSKDSVLELLILLRDFGEELYADTQIQFSVEGISDDLQEQMLDMDEKRQLTMIFKEAMNNALKHANCNVVVLKVEQQGEQIKIGLTDNGKGFVLDHEKIGYGLGSMINRSKKVGGQLAINSELGEGTEVLLEMH